MNYFVISVVSLTVGIFDGFTSPMYGSLNNTIMARGVKVIIVTLIIQPSYTIENILFLNLLLVGEIIGSTKKYHSQNKTPKQ